MRKAKRLSVRQLAFIGDLFGGKLSEQAALEKHHVSRRLYNKWLTNSAFAEEFDRRIAGLYRQNALLIAHNASKAMEELMKLIKGKEESTGNNVKKPEKGETTRKACLDIIKMHLSPRLAGRPKAPDKKATPPPEPPKLSPETASKLLAVLAQEKTGGVS